MTYIDSISKYISCNLCIYFYGVLNNNCFVNFICFKVWFLVGGNILERLIGMFMIEYMFD